MSAKTQRIKEKCQGEPIPIPPEMLRELQVAYLGAIEAQKQRDYAQALFEARHNGWQVALLTAQRDLKVPQCMRLNFEAGRFEMPQVE